jgi:hypothetical protein
MSKNITPSGWTAEEVWAAAAYATRINDGYYKVPEYNADGKPTKIENKILVKAALEDTTQIPDQDFEEGCRARNYIKSRCVLRALKGTSKEFDIAIARAASLDHFIASDRYEIALIASQIVSYKAGIKEEELKSQVDRSLGFLGDIGSEVTATVKVSRVVWSNNYGTFYVSGMTTTNQLVFFNYKNRLTTGNIYSIRGRVKNHRDDTTQINRVKILDK